MTVGMIRIAAPAQGSMQRHEIMKMVLQRMQEWKDENGVGKQTTHTNPTLNEVVDNLSNGRDQKMQISTKEGGRRADRIASVSPRDLMTTEQRKVDDLAQKFLPDLDAGTLRSAGDAIGSKAVAFELAKIGTPGLDKNLRISGVSGPDSQAAYNIIGRKKPEGVSVSDTRKKKMQDTIRETLIDLGADGEDTRNFQVANLLANKFINRPIMLDDQTVREFRHMVKAYHEMREANKPYLEAMVGGMKASQSPERLSALLLPTPDQILAGTTGMVIYDSNLANDLEDITLWIQDTYYKFMNFVRADAPREERSSERAASVNRLLNSFGRNRMNMVRSIEEAVFAAEMSGVDFINSFYGNQEEGGPATLENYLDLTIDAFKDSIEGHEFTVGNEIGPALGIASPQWGVPAIGSAEERDRLLETLVSMKYATKISSTAKESSGFYILPIDLPVFKSRPIGWDRRWMIAIMTVFDQYWDIIYRRQMLLSDILYLISIQTIELFDYELTTEEMYIIALLMRPDSEPYEYQPVRPVGPARVPAGPATPTTPAGDDDGDSEFAKEVEKIRDGKGWINTKENKADELTELLVKKGVSNRNAKRIIRESAQLSKFIEAAEELINKAAVGEAASRAARKRKMKNRRKPVLSEEEAVELEDEIEREWNGSEASESQVQDILGHLGIPVPSDSPTDPPDDSPEPVRDQYFLQSDPEQKFDTLEDLQTFLKEQQMGKPRPRGIVPVVAATKDKPIFKTIGDLIYKPPQETIISVSSGKKTDDEDESLKDFSEKLIIAEFRIQKTLMGTSEEAVSTDLPDGYQENEVTTKTEDGMTTKIQGFIFTKPIGEDQLESLGVESVEEFGFGKYSEAVARAKLGTLSIMEAKVATLVDALEKAAEAGLTASRRDSKAYTKNKNKKKWEYEIEPPIVTSPNNTFNTPPSKNTRIVSAEVVIGMGLSKDLLRAIRDITGGRSATMEKLVREGVEVLIQELQNRAVEVGANSVSNIRIEPITLGANSSMIMLIAYGEANTLARAKNNPLEFECLNCGHRQILEGKGEISSVLKTTVCKKCGKAAGWGAARFIRNPVVATGGHGRSAFGWYHEERDDVIELLKDEGGAAGFSVLKQAFRPTLSEETIRDYLSTMSGVEKHPNGDYILAQGLAPFIQNPNHEMWTKKYTIVSQRDLPLTAMLIKVGWIWSDHKKPHKVNIYDNTGIKLKATHFLRPEIPSNRTRRLEPLFPFALKEELEAKSNPDHPKTKIYKGVEISGKKGAWKVEAYGKKFKSLERARKFISDKVAGATKPDQRCVRKIKGVRCKGIVVLTNPHCYKCNKCKAEYKEA